MKFTKLLFGLFATFNFLFGQNAELIITEFMADPTPVVNILPNAEYIEFYNRSDLPLDLGSYQLGVGNNTNQLPTYILEANSYVLLCDDSDFEAFSALGPAVAIASFPRLTNSGSTLSIINELEETELTFTYNTAWYKDAVKDDGGWSLELGNLEGPYDCALNWIASESENGGTPGAPNSVQSPFQSIAGPQVSLLEVLDPLNVFLEFDRAIFPPNDLPENQFSITPAIDVAAVNQLEEETQLQLILAAPLTAGTIYSLQIGSAIQDCSGATTNSNLTYEFGLVEPIQTGDIILNEILFHPQTGGRDFIEVYNRSNKLVNLKGLKIINEDKLSGNRIDSIRNEQLLAPNQYLAFSPSKEDIEQRYRVLNPDALIEQRLPTLDASSGNVTLEFAETIIDAFDYTNSFHSSLLTNVRGVSLERINPEGPTQDPNNWFSAATNAGFATPGYVNSQFRLPRQDGLSGFQLENATFSPDNDGFQDFLLINYADQPTGTLANIWIYDAEGRIIKKLVTKELLANEGVIKWDGVDEALQKARIGIYVIWIELFDNNNRIGTEKLTCVLAGNLD